jgi:hypothetical protein
VTRDDALEIVRDSMSRGTITPTLGGVDREAYLQEVSAELEAALIDPLVAMVLDEAYHHGLLGLLAEHDALVLARSDEHFLGFVPATGDFFLCYGPDPTRLNALGFYSADALAEWLG